MHTIILKPNAENRYKIKKAMEKMTITGHVAVQVNGGKPVGYWSTLKSKFSPEITDLRLRDIMMSKDQCAESAPERNGNGEIKIAKVTIEIS